MTTCAPPVRPNASPKVVSYTGPDRLSALPDVLLYKILSSLDAREVAQTCILSKRWQNLWASVPCLHFEISDRTRTFSKESCRKFIKLVNGFLFSYDEAACLDSFHLSCRGRRYLHKGIADAATIWIAQAMKHKPKKVQLKFSHYERLTLPDSLYLCNSLEELHISLNFGIDTIPFEPDEVCLPKLKRLQLLNASISPDAMKKICYGCPMLESLSLEYCVLDKQCVTFGSLKSLSLRHCYSGYLGFSIPEVEYFSLVGGRIERISFSNLVNVDVLELRGPRLMDLLKEALRDSLIFHKLKRLILGDFCMNCTSSAVSSLLERASKLETLALWHGCCYETRECNSRSQISREKVEYWFNCKWPEVHVLHQNDIPQRPCGPIGKEKVPTETSDVGRKPLLNKKYLDRIYESKRSVYEMLKLKGKEKVPSETSNVGRKPLLDKKYLDRLYESERSVYEMLMLQPGDTHVFTLKDVDPWGVHTGEVKFSMNVKDILECLKRERLNISILKMYSWLWKEKLTRQWGLKSVIVLDPDMVSSQNIQIDKGRVIDYLKMSFLSVDSKSYILFPYNEGNHWTVMVVSIADYTLYYANSIDQTRSGGPIYSIREILNIALRHYVSDMKIKRNNPTFKWTKLLCSKQKGDFECGYFSMLYMKGILAAIFHDENHVLPMSIEPVGRPYLEEEIAEVVKELMEFMERQLFGMTDI